MGSSEEQKIKAGNSRNPPINPRAFLTGSRPPRSRNGQNEVKTKTTKKQKPPKNKNKIDDIKLKQNRNKILTKYKKFSSTKGMLENKDLLKKTLNKFKPEIIIHLAAQAGVRYSILNPDDSRIDDKYLEVSYS